jgi:hypothetical protein
LLMVSKNFEQTIPFREIRDSSGNPIFDVNGNPIWLPLVTVTIIAPIGSRISLSLYFDTGASVTTLRSEFYPLLGLRSWNEGVRRQTSTGSDTIDVYQYTISMEVFGKTIECPIYLNNRMPAHPFFSGLLGRETIYKEFGFGFWEKIHELYVTPNP